TQHAASLSLWLLLLLLCRPLGRRLLDGRGNLLHALELSRLVGIALVRHFGAFLLNRRLAVAGIRMIREELRTSRASVRLQLLEELRHLDWIVARFRHKVRTEQVCLTHKINRLESVALHSHI